MIKRVLLGLLALVLLATPRQVMLETDLLRQLAACLTLLREAPYSSRITFPQGDAAAIIQAGFKADILLRVGALPTWGHSRSWGYGPSGGLGLVLVVLLVLLLMGRI